MVVLNLSMNVLKGLRIALVTQTARSAIILGGNTKLMKLPWIECVVDVRDQLNYEDNHPQ
jgi:hypothetical protein